MEFRIGDKIYAKKNQYHGLKIIDSEYNSWTGELDFLTTPIYMDGTLIEDCATEKHDMAYLKKNYVPVSKIRKQKLKEIEEKLNGSR
jgi:hypothetical protein